MDTPTLQSFLPSLGFSAVFLLILKIVWDYFVGKLAEAEKRYDAMLQEQQARYDKLEQTYIGDLRDWSGLDPRPQTWLRDDSPVLRRREDVTRPLPQLSQEDQARAEANMSK